MRSITNIICLLSVTYITSCKQSTYQYPQNRQITNEKGMPYDSLQFYYSTFVPIDSSQLKFVKDSFWQNDLSSNMFAFKEPILYNQYLGKEQYRFLLLRSFDLPMVFIIVNENGKITLNTKKIDREPLFRDIRYMSAPLREDSGYMSIGYKPIKEVVTLKNGRIDTITIIKADRKANLIYDSTKILSKNDWDHFIKLIKQANFWKITPYYWEGDANGAMWVFEEHTRASYRYVVRQSPQGKLYEAGKFLVELSGLKEEVY